MRIAEVSRNVSSQRGRNVLADMLRLDEFLAFMDLQSGWEEDGTDHDFRPVDPTQALLTRALGGEYTPADATPAALVAGALKIMGFSFDIDDSHKADAERNIRGIDDWMDKEVSRRGREFARLFSNVLWNGTGSGNNLKGLTTIFDGTTDLPGHTGVTGVIDASAWKSGSPVSLDLSDEANWELFLEQLMNVLGEVPDAAALVMNRSMRARMTRIAAKKHMLGESRELFGRYVREFAGLPMIAARDGGILSVEDDNTGGTPLTNTTSIWILRPGERDFSIVSNSGLDYDDEIDLEKKESRRIKGEIRAAWKTQEKDSARRIRNIKL